MRRRRSAFAGRLGRCRFERRQQGAQQPRQRHTLVRVEALSSRCSVARWSGMTCSAFSTPAEVRQIWILLPSPVLGDRTARPAWTRPSTRTVTLPGVRAMSSPSCLGLRRYGGPRAAATRGFGSRHRLARERRRSARSPPKLGHRPGVGRFPTVGGWSGSHRRLRRHRVQVARDPHQMLGTVGWPLDRQLPQTTTRYLPEPALRCRRQSPPGQAPPLRTSRPGTSSARASRSPSSPPRAGRRQVCRGHSLSAPSGPRPHRMGSTTPPAGDRQQQQ